MVCTGCPRRKSCREICHWLESRLPRLNDNINSGHTLNNARLRNLTRLRLDTKTVVALRGALKGRERLAVRLRYNKALTFKQIAGLMRVSEKRVCQLLDRARVRLRRIIDSQEEES